MPVLVQRLKEFPEYELIHFRFRVFQPDHETRAFAIFIFFS